VSVCAVDDCARPHVARGYCKRHYQLARRNGLGVVPQQTPEELFWSKVAKSADCWLWTGAKTRDGYGQLRSRGQGKYAHRVAYELTRGDIPAGLELDHLCRNPSCVNPDHLEPVTHRENLMRGDSPSARQARKTHCIHGHEFTEANTLRQGSRRRCRACLRRTQEQEKAS
jgi:hypothetical protein